MSSTPVVERVNAILLGVLLGLGTGVAQAQPASSSPGAPMTPSAVAETLTARQQAIIPIGAFGASGHIAQLSPAIEAGLDAGLSVSDVPMPVSRGASMRSTR